MEQRNGLQLLKMRTAEKEVKLRRELKRMKKRKGKDKRWIKRKGSEGMTPGIRIFGIH